jgi:hypothetical protein
MNELSPVDNSALNVWTAKVETEPRLCVVVIVSWRGPSPREWHRPSSSDSDEGVADT